MKRIREAAPVSRARRRKAAITPEDQALWVHVARSTKPLPGRIAPELPDVPEPPPPASEAARQPAPLPAPPRARPAQPLAGIEKKLARQIVRGRIEVDARIDLHGMRQAEAHGALITFIHRAHRSGARIVLVITGKGAPRADGWAALDQGAGWGGERGVLRRLVPHWLADPALRQLVIGFDQAARAHGGEGALYVRIRRPRLTP
jgi:DNA-nicking Smr family endonuclease